MPKLAIPHSTLINDAPHFLAYLPCSEGLRDLIARILVADPAQRLTLQQIQAHPWFTQGLEPGALQFNDAIVQESLANQPTQAMLDQVGGRVPPW